MVSICGHLNLVCFFSPIFVASVFSSNSCPKTTGESPLMTSNGIAVGFPLISLMLCHHVPISGFASAQRSPYQCMYFCLGCWISTLYPTASYDTIYSSYGMRRSSIYNEVQVSVGNTNIVTEPSTCDVSCEGCRLHFLSSVSVLIGPSGRGFCLSFVQIVLTFMFMSFTSSEWWCPWDISSALIMWLVIKS